MTGSRDVLRNFNADGLDSLYPRYAGGPTWLVGRHHWLLALARIGREVLPFLPLMPDAEEQVARLVELHADDAATRARDPRLLATALVVLATAASPAPALAAGATDSVQRIHRLLGPAEPLGRARRQLLRATAAALALTAVLLALTPALVALALGRLPAAWRPPAVGDEQPPGRPRVVGYEDPSPERPVRRARRAAGQHDGRPGRTAPLAAAPPPGPRERPARAGIRHRR